MSALYANFDFNHLYFLSLSFGRFMIHFDKLVLFSDFAYARSIFRCCIIGNPKDDDYFFEKNRLLVTHVHEQKKSKKT